MKTFNFKSLLNNSELQLRNQLIQHVLQQPTTPIPFTAEYQALLDRHVLNIENQQITCLYPFALTATDFKVTLTETGQTVYAMCAVDAIGIYDTLQTPIKIEAQCAKTHVPLYLEVYDDKIHNLTEYPDIHVLYKDLCPENQCCVNCCPYIQFFKDEAALEMYYKTHINQFPIASDDPSYHSIALTEARDVAKTLFS